MKRVAFGAEPKVLADFRSANPAATWSQFKHEPGNEVVFDTLASAQGFLCAYCEIGIDRRRLRGEVEHFEPKSSASADRNFHLEFANLLACCEGGIHSWDTDRSLPPIAETRHCGALKGDTSPAGLILNPRSVPAHPTIWRTTSQGRLEVDGNACLQAGVNPDLAATTLDALGLNRPVLVRLRAALLAALDGELAVLLDEEIPDYLVNRGADLLVPTEAGHLSAFWSTIRAWVGPSIEPFLAANAHRIPGLTG